MQQIIRLFNANNATINFETQGIRRIFVVNYATNESLYISKRCRDVNMIRQDPKHTKICVRKPALRRRTSRSKPIKPPKITAKIRRPITENPVIISPPLKIKPQDFTDCYFLFVVLKN